MRKPIHAAAGTGALVLVSGFWLSTVASELSGSAAAMVMVKTTIPWLLPLMVLLMAAAGGSGLAMAGGARAGRIGAKRRRMPFIALNGLLVLTPCALFLAHQAAAGPVGGAFYTVQAVELAAGAVNIALLGLNMRDGIAMARGGPARAPGTRARPAGRRRTARHPSP